MTATPRFVIRLILLFVFTVLVQGVSIAETAPQVPPCTGLRWIVNSGSLRTSQPDFPLELQRKFFDSTCTFLVMSANPPRDYKDWRAIRTHTITSLSQLDRAAADSSTMALLYDDERWEMTPEEEQAHPVQAACRAAAIAHANGKIVIATPAINLIRVLDPGSTGGDQRFADFARTNVAGRISKCVDVYEIQAQGAEKDTQKFRDFVVAEARQARAANPKIIVLAGISTNPSGQQVTAQELLKAVESVRDFVDGFWLNIPAGGKYCPRCGTPQPGVAVRMFEMLKAR